MSQNKATDAYRKILLQLQEPYGALYFLDTGTDQNDRKGNNYSKHEICYLKYIIKYNTINHRVL